MWYLYLLWNQDVPYFSRVTSHYSESEQMNIEDEDVIEYLTQVILTEENCLDFVKEYLEDYFQKKTSENSENVKEERSLETSLTAEKILDGFVLKEIKEENVNLDKKEWQVKQKILEKYSIDRGDEYVENAKGELEVIYKSADESSKTFQVVENENRTRVKDEERMVRETQRIEHLKKKEREKELLEKQRLKEVKKKTQKQERRRM
ncbi:hypothetical protein ROZALSC1DRAFT_30924 [Rozella allomycis CSF55]|uniref:Coiled-coil domain-containing protein 43 n=1 Tax=Rozella allomycis (strain CSF55) TaxID=988480 RepID=A0A075B1X8_ROZAC|nr:hypothetical protein O9G_004501 [Rozella allomycis CSF55]RKP17243.1 hypothetical protein ROZALSC1DRAFT_30924 [Rozella allomycis CSF55]|eukprot:EPZ36375.1 hypothetical protein O9G_004501 [Rozella allomycis CSF55]